MLPSTCGCSSGFRPDNGRKTPGTRPRTATYSFGKPQKSKQKNASPAGGGLLARGFAASKPGKEKFTPEELRGYRKRVRGKLNRCCEAVAVHRRV